MIGKKLAHYEILERIGTGGMGEVYRAKDTRLGREVAIKVLPAEMARDPERIERFRREARALAALDHPNIVTLFSVEEWEGTHFLTMGLVEGETLDRVIPDGGMKTDLLLDLAATLAESLAAAHEKGIVHRDLKPQNIMIASDGRLKVLDFGLAKLAEPSLLEAGGPATVVATRAGFVMGTPAYMSPEQVEGRPLDHRTDIFVLGILLHEMATGKRPFRGESPTAVMAGILRDDPPPLAATRSDLPDGLGPIVRRCLAKDPAQRYANTREIGAALNVLRDDVARSSSGMGQSSIRTAATARRDDRSLVVLPFANLSPEAENEYFSDGLTEEVIADLSNVEVLRVISRTSSMHYKGTTKNLRAIGQELQVRYALEGSVRRAGNSLRITVKLIDTESDRHIWSEKYGGTLDDVFEIQEKVSRAIVDALRIQLSPSEERKLEERPFQNGYVYDLYLRARADIQSFTRERLQRAVRDLQNALQIAGDNVLIYRGLGMASWQFVNAGFSSDMSYLDEAERYAKKILELDPDGPHGHVVMGYVAGQRGARQEWVRRFQRASAIDPHDTEALIWLAIGWILAGRPAKASSVLDRLAELEPLMDWTHFLKGINDYFAGRPEEARRHYQKTLDLGSEHPGLTMLWVQLLGSTGDLEGATAILARHATDPGAHPLVTLAYVLLRALRGETEDVRQLATKEFLDKMWPDVQYTHVMAQAYAVLGERDEATRWLTRAVDRGFIAYPFLAQHDVLLQNLRGDAGFEELMERTRVEWEAFEMNL